LIDRFAAWPTVVRVGTDDDDIVAVTYNVIE